jgi:hypothetical protein
MTTPVTYPAGDPQSQKSGTALFRASRNFRSLIPQRAGELARGGVPEPPLLPPVAQGLMQRAPRADVDPLRRGYGFRPGKPGEDREHRAQTTIIGPEPVLDPVQDPPLSARPTPAGRHPSAGARKRTAGRTRITMRSSLVVPPQIPSGIVRSAYERQLPATAQRPQIAFA